MIEKNAPNFLKKSGLSFTILINETLDCIKDAAALGIYIYLSSKPEDWIIREKDLMNRFDVGRDFIRSKMKILKEIGLMEVIAHRDSGGHIVKWETIIHNQITEKPSSGVHQITENPTSGETHLLANPTHTKKRKILKKKEDTTTTKDGVGRYFSKLLKAYKDNPVETEAIKSSEDFIEACKYSIEHRGSNFTEQERVNGICMLVRMGEFIGEKQWIKNKSRKFNAAAVLERVRLQEERSIARAKEESRSYYESRAQI